MATPGPTPTPTPAELRLRPLRIDPAEYDVEDAAGTVGGAPHRWRWIVRELDEVPGAAVVALEGMADALGAAGGSGRDLSSLSEGVVARLRLLAEEHGPRTRLVDVVGPADALLTAVEACDTMLSAAGRAVAHATGVVRTGRLEQVNVGPGGVPKVAVAEAEVWPRGLVGDRQRKRRHHGRPFQAVSLWSTEVVAALAAEGHPIGPGQAGENLDLSGLVWGELRPGVRLLVGGGDPVCLELTSWAPPCETIAGCFLERRFERIDFDGYPGWARAYAAVVRPGRLRVGDPVTVMP